jgi:hypothetical protein
MIFQLFLMGNFLVSLYTKNIVLKPDMDLLCSDQ